MGLIGLVLGFAADRKPKAALGSSLRSSLPRWAPFSGGETGNGSNRKSIEQPVAGVAQAARRVDEARRGRHFDAEPVGQDLPLVPVHLPRPLRMAGVAGDVLLVIVRVDRDEGHVGMRPNEPGHPRLLAVRGRALDGGEVEDGDPSLEGRRGATGERQRQERGGAREHVRFDRQAPGRVRRSGTAQGGPPTPGIMTPGLDPARFRVRLAQA